MDSDSQGSFAMEDEIPTETIPTSPCCHRHRSPNTPRLSRKTDEDRSPRIPSKNGGYLRIRSPDTEKVMQSKGLWDPEPKRFTCHASPNALRPIPLKTSSSM